MQDSATPFLPPPLTVSEASRAFVNTVQDSVGGSVTLQQNGASTRGSL